MVVGSVITRAADGSYRNRLYWARPDGSCAHYDKRHLFRMAGEHEHYAAGEERVLLQIKGWHVRPLVCYDLRFPVWSRDPHDTDLLLYIASWPAARRNRWNRLLPARGIENLCYVAAVNRIGEDGNGVSARRRQPGAGLHRRQPAGTPAMPRKCSTSPCQRCCRFRL